MATYLVCSANRLNDTKVEEMISLIECSGLIYLKSYDADTMGEATDKSERIYCVAKKTALNNK